MTDEKIDNTEKKRKAIEEDWETEAD